MFRETVWACALAQVVLLAPYAKAQETINFASLSGRVTDPSDLVVQDAQVTVRQTETNSVTAASTDKEGRFRFAYLRVGSYNLTIHQPGFADFKRLVVLSVGAAFDLPVALTIGSAKSVAVVADIPPLIETTRSQLAGTVEQVEIANLPLNGRSFVDLALVLPGVSPTNTASTQLFPETSAAPGQGISVSSQRNFSNSFIVDGVSGNDDAAGLVATFYGLDVVREFQVVVSGGQAEFGRALGGYVNMITKSGTNSIHGDAYGYFKNQRFNAANPLTNTALPLTQAQYGASLGGPIIRDRTFYFANFEQRSLNQEGVTTILPANVGAINSRLLATGYGGSLISTGLFPNPVHNSNFLAKLDHDFAATDRFNVRYSLYQVDSKNSRGAGALSAPSAAAALHNNDQTVAASNIWTLSPQTVNETRGQFTYSNLTAPPNDQIGPAVSISGVASFGTLSASPTGRLDKLYEVSDNLSHRAGAHALRAGFDFLYNDLTITFPKSIRGSYSFSSLVNFLKGSYNNAGFSQTFGNTIVAQTNPNVGFYAQDEWKISSSLTLNLGVRYDLQWLKTVATDTNNISPRAGFAWTPNESRRTAIRGSFGLFYDRVPLRPLANALLSSNNTTMLTSTTQIGVSLAPTQLAAPIFPNILNSVPAGVLVNYSTMDQNMQNAYSEQGSIELEQQLSNSGTLSVSYQHLRGRHLIVSLNQNVPSCIASGTNNGCRPNSSYGNNSQYSPLADSEYDGLAVSYLQRPVRWGSYRISYTYSKALDDVSEFFFSAPLNNFNIWQDWARSDDDQRHRLTFDATVHTSYGKPTNAWQAIAHGVQLSGLFQYYSPLPFNITTGSTTIQGTSARPAAGGGSIGRNLGSGFAFFNVNARLSRVFTLSEKLKLEAIAESFNILNHRNDLIPNGTFGTGAYPSAPLSTFGQPTAVADARSFQLALKISF